MTLRFYVQLNAEDTVRRLSRVMRSQRFQARAEKRRKKLATINDAKIIREIIQDNGRYHDDNPVIAVVEYHNQFNGSYAYGLCWLEREIYGYLNSAACIGARILWTEIGGLTEAGKKFMMATENLNYIIQFRSIGPVLFGFVRSSSRRTTLYHAASSYLADGTS